LRRPDRILAVKPVAQTQVFVVASRTVLATVHTTGETVQVRRLLTVEPEKPVLQTHVFVVASRA